MFYNLVLFLTSRRDGASTRAKATDRGRNHVVIWVRQEKVIIYIKKARRVCKRREEISEKERSEEREER